MTIDNLPSEMPRDASAYFGEQFIKYILPELLSSRSEVIQRATVAENGHLTGYFQYLKDYVEGLKGWWLKTYSKNQLFNPYQPFNPLFTFS